MPTGLSPAYEQRSAERRGPTGRKAAARTRVHAPDNSRHPALFVDAVIVGGTAKGRGSWRSRTRTRPGADRAGELLCEASARGLLEPRERRAMAKPAFSQPVTTPVRRIMDASL